MTTSLTDRVVAAEQRQRARGATQQAALRRAVGAIVGGVLWNWTGSTPTLSARSQANDSFTEEPVTRHAFQAARDALRELGLLGCRDGIRMPDPGGFRGDWRGFVARFWPTEPLLALAQQHGVTADRARTDFRHDIPTTAPRIRKPVRVKSLKERRGRQELPGRDLAVDWADPRMADARDEVLMQNLFAERVPVSGCTPPRWYRMFTLDARLGGRWWATGGTRVTHQTMPAAQRLDDIRIAGKRVVEVDVSAAHLTILHGLAGLPLPEGDLYGGVEDATQRGMPWPVPRETVKAWTTQAIGKGAPSVTWGRQTEPEHRQHRAKAIRAAMVARYPILENLWRFVPADLRDVYRAHHQVPSLYLQAIEAEALTIALAQLREAGILGLPMHDGLIVPESAAEVAERAWREAFRQAAGIEPRVSVKG